MFGIFLGIEIKEDSAVFSYLKNDFSGITVLSVSEFLLTDTEGAINEIIELSGKIGPVKKVFVSLPDRWATMKFISLPSVQGKRQDVIASMFSFEIERHIPYDIEDVVTDFSIVAKKNDLCNAWFAAVHKEKIDFVNEYLRKLSLKPEAMTVSSIASINAIDLSGGNAGGWREITGISVNPSTLGQDGESNILLYIGKKDLLLATVRDRLCVHINTSVDIKELSADLLIDRVSSYLKGLDLHPDKSGFDKIIIAGEFEGINGFDGKLRTAFSDTFKEVLYHEVKINGTKIDHIPAPVGACLSGLGLGRYKINLLPHRIDLSVSRRVPLTTKILIGLIVCLSIGIVTANAIKKKSYATEVNELLDKNRPAVMAIEEMLSETDILKEKTDTLRNLRDNDISLEIIAELTSILPKEAWITNLHYKGIDRARQKKGRKDLRGELLIRGYADSSSTLIPILEDSPFFEKVEFVGTIKKTREKEQFRLSAQVIRPDNKDNN